MAGRVRRTNAEIDNAVMTELEKLVIRNGFDKVLVTELMANASLEPPVFYRRYGSIDNLLDQRHDQDVGAKRFGPQVVFCENTEDTVQRVMQ